MTVVDDFRVYEVTVCSSCLTQMEHDETGDFLCEHCGWFNGDRHTVQIRARLSDLGDRPNLAGLARVVDGRR